jgi:Ca2+-binding RTX toxin-like protein
LLLGESEASRELWKKVLYKLGVGADVQQSKEALQGAFTAESLRPVVEEILGAFRWESEAQKKEVAERDAQLLAGEFGDDVAEAVQAVLGRRGGQTVSGQELAEELGKKSARLRVWEGGRKEGQSGQWLQRGYDEVEVLSVLELMAGGEGYGVGHTARQFYDALGDLGKLGQLGVGQDKLRERYALAVRQEAQRQGVQEGAAQEAVLAREMKQYDLRYAPLLKQLQDSLAGGASGQELAQQVAQAVEQAPVEERRILGQVTQALAGGMQAAAQAEEGLGGLAPQEGAQGGAQGSGQGYDEEAINELAGELAQARELARLLGSGKEEDVALGRQLQEALLKEEVKARGLGESAGALQALSHYNGYFMDGYMLVGVGRTLWQLGKAREQLVSAGQDTSEIDKLLIQQGLLGGYTLGLLGSKVALQVGQVLKSEFVPLVEALSGGAGGALMGYFALTQAKALGDSVNRYIADHNNGVIRHEDDWAVAGDTINLALTLAAAAAGSLEGKEALKLALNVLPLVLPDWTQIGRQQDVQAQLLQQRQLGLQSDMQLSALVQELALMREGGSIVPLDIERQKANIQTLLSEQWFSDAYRQRLASGLELKTDEVALARQRVSQYKALIDEQSSEWSTFCANLKQMLQGQSQYNLNTSLGTVSDANQKLASEYWKASEELEEIHRRVEQPGYEHRSQADTLLERMRGEQGQGQGQGFARVYEVGLHSEEFVFDASYTSVADRSVHGSYLMSLSRPQDWSGLEGLQAPGAEATDEEIRAWQAALKSRYQSLAPVQAQLQQVAGLDLQVQQDAALVGGMRQYSWSLGSASEEGSEESGSAAGNTAGNALVVVRDAGQQDPEALLAIDATALGGSNRYELLRGRVDLRLGSGDDSIYLTQTDWVSIHGAGGDKTVNLQGAQTGQHIEWARFEQVGAMLGSGYADYVTDEIVGQDAGPFHTPGDPWARIDEGELVYDWGGQANGGSQALQGDQVELLGAAGHTVVIGAGEVELGAGQDTVVVDNALAGSVLAVHGGLGQDTLDLQRLGPVQLQGGSFTAQTGLGLQEGVNSGVQSGSFEGMERVIGSRGDDTLVITESALRQVQGGAGQDYIEAGAGWAYAGDDALLVDGGEGDDYIRVRAVSGARVLAESGRDVIVVDADVQDVSVGVGVFGNESGALAQVAIHAQDSQAHVRLDLIEGTAEVWLGAGGADIVLGSTAVRLIVHDQAQRWGDLSIRYAGAAGMDAAGLASLIEWRGQAGEGAAYASYLPQTQAQTQEGPIQEGEPQEPVSAVEVDLAQLLGQAGQGEQEQALWVNTAPVYQAWSGVRTVLGAARDVVIGADSERASQAWAQEAGARVQALQTQLAPYTPLLEGLKQIPLQSDGQTMQVDGALVRQLSGQDIGWLNRVYSAWDAADAYSGARGQLSAGQQAQLDEQRQGHLLYDPRLGSLGAAKEDLLQWVQALQGQASDAQRDWLIERLQAALVAPEGVGVNPLRGNVADNLAVFDALVARGLAQAQVLSWVSQGLDGALSWGQVAREELQAVLTQRPGLSALVQQAQDAGQVRAGTLGLALYSGDGGDGHFTVDSYTVQSWSDSMVAQSAPLAGELARLQQQLAHVQPYELGVAGQKAPQWLQLQGGVMQVTAPRDNQGNVMLDVWGHHQGEEAHGQALVQLRRFEGEQYIGTDAGDEMARAVQGEDAGAAVLMAGGRGDDTYEVEQEGDIVFENPDEGHDVVRAGVSYTLGGGIEELVLTGAAVQGVGNEEDNVITGTSGANRLAGGAGDDTLAGGGAGVGEDVLDGGEGLDVVRLAGAVGEYVLSDVVRDDGQWEVLIEDRVAGRDGTIRATNVEALQFAGAAAGQRQTWLLDELAVAPRQALDAGSLDLWKWIASSAVRLDMYGQADREELEDAVLARAQDPVQQEFRVELGASWLGRWSAYGDGYTDEAENAALGWSGDVLTGDEGRDALFGRAGNDMLVGAGGDDALAGGEGDDTLNGGSGRDVLAGGAGNDTYVLSGADFVQYGLGEIIERAAQAPSGGDDEQQPERNAVVVDTGDGVWSSGIRVDISGRSELSDVSLQGDAWWAVRGNAGDNVLRGNAGRNELEGGDGDDTLSGGGGQDMLDGGLGNDVYELDALQQAQVYDVQGGLNYLASIRQDQGGQDTVVLQTAGGQELGLKWLDLSQRLDLDRGQLRGEMGWGVRGNAVDNVLTGDASGNWLQGLAGADTLQGGGGADTLEGGEGDDTYLIGMSEVGEDGAGSVSVTLVEQAGQGWDVVVSQQDFTLGENFEELRLDGGAMGLVGVGNAQDNRILGGDGDDTLDGGSGADWLGGGDGSDVYVVDNAQDQVIEEEDLAILGGVDKVLAGVDYTLGANVEDLQLTGAGDLTGTGNALDNVLAGNAGKNVLDGASGEDTVTLAGSVEEYLFLRHSDGTLYVGDLVAGRGAVDTWRNIESVYFEGSQESWSVQDLPAQSVLAYIASYNDLMDAFGANETEGAKHYVNYGYAEGRSVSAEALNFDALKYVASNADLLTYFGQDAAGALRHYIDFGHSEVRTIDASLAIQVATGDMGQSLNGGDGNDGLFGAAGNDTLNGGAGSDGLSGGDGDDWLDGGAGADRLGGGAGNDTYVVDDAGDMVAEAQGQGMDTIVASVSYTLGQNLAGVNAEYNNVENLTLAGTANINGSGNALDNVIIGNGGNNVLDGGAGADTMIGGAGNDSYVVDDAGDVVIENANEGSDTVFTREGYTLGANLENLTLTGAGWWDLKGNELGNVLSGNEGWNMLDGAAGADTMMGGAGNDTYVVDNAGDVVIENANEGTDAVSASVSYTLGASVENLTLTGTANLSGTGNAQANVITGNSGSNVLNGGAGADTMIGGAGNDSYVVDDAGDVVSENANEGTDSVSASVSYTLGANVESLMLAGMGNLSGTGNGLNNTITGNSGNNVLDGGAGADTMMGGAGNDSYVVDNAGDVVSELTNEGTDSVSASVSYTLGVNVENLTLSGTGAINGVGNTLNNVLTGNSAANTLDGGAGVDTLAGGAGNDSYVVDNAGDVVIENANEGTDLVSAGISYTLGANVESLTLSGTANLNGTGNALANVITGNSGSNVLDGGAGADTLAGGAGNDSYVVDNAGDVAVENAGEGADMVSASVSYTLGANLENLMLMGNAAINATGNSGGNMLNGNAAGNVLDGGAGADTMAGGFGNDTYVVDNAGDVVIENAGEGSDTVSAGISYTLGANVENLTLTGTANIDGTGNALDNTLRGNAGKNILDGAGGVDTVVLGGEQSDYTFMSAAGVIYVGDKTAGRDGLSQWKNMEKVTFLGSGQTLDISALNVPSALDYIASYPDLIAAFGANEASGATHYWNYGYQEGRTVSFEGLKYIAAYADLMAAFGADEALGAKHYIQNGRSEIAAGTRAAGSVQQTSVTLVGGQVRDQVSMVARAMQMGTAGSDSLTGAAGNDGLFGLGSDDSLVGGAGNDGLAGGVGNDTLDGGAGLDQMAGGAGNDSYVVDNAGDTVAENANEGTDTILASVSYALGQNFTGVNVVYNNVENLTLSGTGNLNGTGNALANVITGNSGANTLSGGDGDDYLIGGAGNDTLLGGNGNDTFSSGAGSDTLSGEAGNDKYLFARADGLDTIVESTGTDKLGFALTGGATGRIDYNQLWFTHEAGTNNLDIRVMGSTDEVKVRDWYLGSGNRLETIEAASSEGVAIQLLGVDVQRLVDAMAGMSPPAGATSWDGLATSQRQQLQGLGVWS